MKNYTFGFSHSTGHGEKFLEYVTELEITDMSSTTDARGWTEYSVYIDFYADSDTQAKERAVALFKQLNDMFDIAVFTLSNDSGLYFTEENL